MPFLLRRAATPTAASINALMFVGKLLWLGVWMKMMIKALCYTPTEDNNDAYLNKQ